MKWIDSTTAILSDSSIVNFYADGAVELFPPTKNNGWKMTEMKKSTYGIGKCHQFKFATMKNAVNFFSVLDNQIENEKTGIQKNNTKGNQ